MDKRILEGLKPEDKERFDTVNAIISELLSEKKLSEFVTKRSGEVGLGPLTAMQLKETLSPFLSFLKAEAKQISDREITKTYEEYTASAQYI